MEEESIASICQDLVQSSQTILSDIEKLKISRNNLAEEVRGYEMVLSQLTTRNGELTARLNKKLRDQTVAMMSSGCLVEDTVKIPVISTSGTLEIDGSKTTKEIESSGDGGPDKSVFNLKPSSVEHREKYTIGINEYEKKFKEMRRDALALAKSAQPSHKELLEYQLSPVVVVPNIGQDSLSAVFASKSKIVYGTQNGIVRELSGMRQTAVLDIGTPVTSLAALKGNVIAVGAMNGQLILWDSKLNNQTKVQLFGSFNLARMVFHEGLGAICCISSGGGLKIFDTTEGREFRSEEVGEVLKSVAVHPAGNILATGGDKSHGIKLWDLRQPNPCYHRSNSACDLSIGLDAKTWAFVDDSLNALGTFDFPPDRKSSQLVISTSGTSLGNGRLNKTGSYLIYVGPQIGVAELEKSSLTFNCVKEWSALESGVIDPLINFAFVGDSKETVAFSPSCIYRLGPKI